jgi:hypothetical protein
LELELEPVDKTYQLEELEGAKGVFCISLTFALQTGLPSHQPNKYLPSLENLSPTKF